MTKATPVYNEETVQAVREQVVDCETWLEAREKIAEYLGIHKDNVTRQNRKYGFWGRQAVSAATEEADEKSKAHLPKRKIKRLYLDIETSPNVVLSWRIGYKINLDNSNILKERAIICVGYKWQHEKEAHALQWDANQDDKAMLVKMLEIANEADEIVMHNGDKFDLPWLKTRCLFHGLEPLPEYKTVDTLQWCRRKFYFNSNKLDYVARFLGIGGKIKTEFGLWKEIVLNKCSKSMGLMVAYCKQDVLLLERVWERLSKVVNPKTHVGVLGGNEKWSCPHCGSEDVRMSKERVTARGSVQYQMRCNDCGAYYTISEAAYRDFLTAKT